VSIIFDADAFACTAEIHPETDVLSALSASSATARIRSPQKRTFLEFKRACRRLTYYQAQARRWRDIANKRRKQSADNLSVDDIIKAAAKYISGHTLAFFASQLRASQRQPTGRR